MSGIQNINSPKLRVAPTPQKEQAEGTKEKPEAEVTLERFDHAEAERSEAKYLERAQSIFQNPNGVKPASKGLLATGFQAASNVVSDIMAHFLLGPIPEPMPIEESRKLGQEEVAEFKTKYPVIKDPERQARLDKAIAKAEEALGKRPEGAENLILETSMINAGASSDGTIIVSRDHLDGLTDQQLLFVASHEVGHVHNGDCAMVDAMDKQERELGPLSPRQEGLMTHRKQSIYHPFERKADDAGLAGLEYHDVPKEHGATYFLRDYGVRGDFSERTAFTGTSETHPSHKERIWRIASSDSEK